MKASKCGDRETFVKLFYESKTISELYTKLGYKTKGKYACGGGYRIIKRKLREYNLDSSRFDTNVSVAKSWAKGLSRQTNESIGKSALKREKPWDECFKIGSTTKNQSLLRRLVLSGKREYKCERCGIDEWDGEKLVLELHHKNGIYNDSREENLQIICPNCHSHTRKGKTSWILTPSEKREARLKYPNIYRKPMISEIDPLWRHKPRLNKRKVKRPSKEELEHMLVDTPWTTIAKKYGVTDNAVRKWAKSYNINQLK